MVDVTDKTNDALFYGTYDECYEWKSSQGLGFKVVKLEQDEITTSKKDLLDCIHNRMGILDTPVSRFKFRDSFSEEAREIGRRIMKENGRGKF